MKKLILIKRSFSYAILISKCAYKRLLQNLTLIVTIIDINLKFFI